MLTGKTIDMAFRTRAEDRRRSLGRGSERRRGRGNRVSRVEDRIEGGMQLQPYSVQEMYGSGGCRLGGDRCVVLRISVM